MRSEGKREREEELEEKEKGERAKGQGGAGNLGGQVTVCTLQTTSYYRLVCNQGPARGCCITA